MNKLFISILVLWLAVGCASTNEFDAEISESRMKIQEANIKAREVLAQKPTISFKCDSKCELQVFDYDELPELQKLDHYVTAHEANVRMTETVMSNLVPMVGILGLVKFGADALDAAGSGNSTIHNTSTINGDDNQISATAEMGGATNSISTVDSTVGDTITQSTDNSTTDRNDIVDNSQVIDNDNSTTDSYNATSTPTVVEPSVHVFDPIVVQP